MKANEENRSCGVGKEHDPVHFNMRNRLHAWVCVSCGKLLAGDLTADELEGFVAFARSLRVERGKKKEGGK